MRNVVMAAMLVAAGVSSSYVNRTGGSETGAEGVAKGKTPLLESSLPQPIDDPMDLLRNFLDPTYDPQLVQTSCVDPIDRLRELLNSNGRPCAAQEKPKALKVPDGAFCKATREFEKPDLNLTFMIATIPDPEKTHLGLDFDRILEAIINAAEDGGFSYDRYWLPWHVNHDLANTDPLKQDIIDGRAEARHRKPGAIIFRRRRSGATNIDPKAPLTENTVALEESRNGALVVFLVGETPTAGINRAQFKNAAGYLKLYNGCSYALGVLGPTFSGSSASLRSAWQADFPHQSQGALVISGSASSFTALAGLGDSTIHSDAFLSSALRNLLQTQLRLSGGVVYLKEAATDFGQTSLDPYSGNGNASNIYYPREISRLRNVYPEQNNTAATEVASLQQQLALRLRDSRLGEETLPEFSDQTPLTQEAVLLQISETLRRDHVGLAVITGTDVLDVLFLSRHLRELSPDVRQLIWDADLLFVHGTDTLDYSGTLALSTYPLVPSNHTWTDSRLPYSYFANNRAEGVYNACLLLLADPAYVPYLREYASPKIKPPSPSTKNEWPPAWLSVIGDDAYWPLGFINDTGSDPAMLGIPSLGLSALDPGRPTRSWSSIFYGCTLLVFLYSGVFIYVVLLPTNQMPRWCSFLHPRPYQQTTWRASYFLLMTLFLSLAYASLWMPVLRLGFAQSREKSLNPWVVMLAVGLVALLCLLSVLIWALHFVSSVTVKFTAILGSVAAFAMVYFANFRFGQFANEESFFRALRSVQIGSGVGPDLPLFFLCLAIAWWASIQIQRARFDAEHRVTLPEAIANEAGFNIQHIDNWLGHRFLYLDRFGIAVVAAGAVVTGSVAIPHIISVDGLFFDGAVCILLIFVCTTLFLTTYGFARIWRTLDRLLEALETQPIRFGFSNLPSDVSWSPLWQYGVRRKSYATLVRTLESLKRLNECDPHFYADLSADIDSLQGRVQAVLIPVNRGIEESIEDAEALRNCRGEIVRKLSEALEARGWNKSYSESLEKIKKEAGSKTVYHGSASWFRFGVAKNIEITSTPAEADPEDKPEKLAAEIVALGYLGYIRYVMRHLRNLLSFITTGFILMTLALNCYPFQMLNLIRWSITLVFALNAVILLFALQQMSRNEILRRVTDTPAGAIDTGLYTRAISLGALPLLAVVASHFPSVGRFLFSWVQPAISALH